jgi:hypothetical protein
MFLAKYPHPESEHYMVTVSSPDSDTDLKFHSRFLADKIAIKKGRNKIYDGPFMSAGCSL